MSWSTEPFTPVLEPGTCFGRYRIIRLIGEGGMGAVYQARHIELHKVVALKTLDAADDGRTRLLNEGEAAARIRHRNVVDVYDVGTHDDTVYLVMEYLEGQDLRSVINEGRTFDHAQLTALLLPLCAALQAAHQQGVVHRDVKPSNVFLARSEYEEMTPKLLDFGISKLVDQKTRAGEYGTGLLVGTLPYMAPEQALGARAGGSIDQYSLGVMMYRIVTGRLPFPSGVSLQELLLQVSQGRYLPPNEAFPDIDRDLEAVIVRAMAREPSERFASMLTLGRALMAFADTRTYEQWRPVFGDADIRTTTLRPQRVRSPSNSGRTPSNSGRTPSNSGAARVGATASGASSLAPEAARRSSGDTSSASVAAESSRFADVMVMHRPLWIPVAGVAAVILAILAGLAVGGWISARRAAAGRVVIVGAEAGDGSAQARTAGPRATPRKMRPRATPADTRARSSKETPRILEPRSSSSASRRAQSGTVSSVLAAVAPRPRGSNAVSALPRFDVEVVAVPTTARIKVDGQLIGRGIATKTFVRNGTRHVLTVEAKGYRSKRIEFLDEPPRSTVVLEALGAKAGYPTRKKKMKKHRRRKPPPLPDVGTNDALIIP